MTDRTRLTGFNGLGWLAWGCLLIPQVKEAFSFVGQRWAYIALFAFLLSYLLTPIVREIAFKFSILDQPAARKVHKKATPLLGGLAVYLSFTTALLANNILNWSVGCILIGSSVVVLISLIDDIKDLSAKLKLVVQIGATILVFWSGTRISLFPIDPTGGALNALSYTGNLIITFLWIVGITNAMNFLDGTDGLATGLGAIISMLLGIVAFQSGQTFLGWFAIAMMGSCLGFLPRNFRMNGPALIFLGDTGSTFIGFTLACLAIKGEWATGNPLVSICTPILIFGVPIFDMTHTTVSRIATGKVRSFQDWVAYVGKDHIHHRLFRVFQSNKKTVCLILAITGGLGISAVVMRQADTLNSLLIVFQGVLAFSIFSAVNFYQEKAMIRLDNTRGALRVHESFHVAANMAVSGKAERFQAVVVDISDSGAKLVLRDTVPVEMGKLLTLSIDKQDSTQFPLPEGKVVRIRKVLLDGENRGYIECGVEFLRSEEFDILELIRILQKSETEVKSTTNQCIAAIGT